MSSWGALLLAVGYRNGEHDRIVQEADELTNAAKELRVKLEAYQRAPDPFAALLSDMHNNREFEKDRVGVLTRN